MAYLLDTGILLRLVDDNDPQHALVEAAVGALGNQGETIVITTQNIAEFWNVATRPAANNGLALPPAKVSDLFDNTIEPICAILTETANVHGELKRLLVKHNVVGKQVHDARLVATMLCGQVDHILTLNERNFLRYQPEGVTVVAPAALAASGP